MSLWMDLADVLVSYRTIVERFGHLRRAPRRKRISIDVFDIDREIGILRSRALPELSAERVTILANRLLHETWHPGGTRTLGFELYWKGTGINAWTSQRQTSENPLIGSWKTQSSRFTTLSSPSSNVIQPELAHDSGFWTGSVL
jgi:hypothetical protein